MKSILNSKWCSPFLGALLLPLLSHSEPNIPLWGLEVGVSPGVCARNVQFEWPGIERFSDSGKRSRTICKTVASQAVDVPLPGAPLTLSWTDSAGSSHAVSLDLRRALSGRTVYGGSIRLELSDDHVKVLLAEPDKSKNPNDTFWPHKPAIVVLTSK